ncbi:predicted protein [Naegleria gruberi]|uniref:Predicted protein n=1 Tax=Naegleria gruberi TaxID=5762 RepID=D2V8B2_NAEGR|nr:uncharacterized protein NAEGRDRAFT_47475 [Naegleria gruberi]EFC47013.1 predicted protein [Naegleria gruberi]|eukprot:XP_002679757.1 predicted protein [Naegleria gruberi strain NEG-M]
MAFLLCDTNNLFDFLQVRNSSNSIEANGQPIHHTNIDLIDDTNMFDDWFHCEDENQLNSSQLESSQHSSPPNAKPTSSKTAHAKPKQMNTDYLYGVIDHVLQDTKSEIGLKWSMLECSSQLVDSSIQSPLSDSTLSINNVTPKENYGRSRSGSSNTTNTTTCNTINSNQSQDIESTQTTTFNNISEFNNTVGDHFMQNMTTCFDKNNYVSYTQPTCMQQRKIKKSQKKRSKSIQFISEEGNSYPLQLESFNCSLSNSPLNRNNLSVKSNKRKSMFNQPFQKTTKEENPNSYKIRFSHNVFEEITFKNTNPSQKFYKFNGIGEDKIN